MIDDEEKEEKRKHEWWEEFLYNVMMETARQMFEQTIYDTACKEFEDIEDIEIEL